MYNLLSNNHQYLHLQLNASMLTFASTLADRRLSSGSPGATPKNCLVFVLSLQIDEWTLPLVPPVQLATDQLPYKYKIVEPEPWVGKLCYLIIYRLIYQLWSIVKVSSPKCWSSQNYFNNHNSIFYLPHRVLFVVLHSLHNILRYINNKKYEYMYIN